MAVSIFMIDEKLKQKLRKKYGDEEVLVCRSTLASNISDRFTMGKKADYLNLSRQGSYIKRYDAEYNPVFLQLVSYIIVTDPSEQWFYVSRRKGGDERLRDTWSFFGGHINPCDMGADTPMKAARRELKEEVLCKIDGDFRYIGFVRDNAGPTSEHLGIVFMVHVKSAEVKEKDNLEGEWVTRPELFSHYNDFEAWGKYILDRLYEEGVGKA